MRWAKVYDLAAVFLFFFIMEGRAGSLSLSLQSQSDSPRASAKSLGSGPVAFVTFRPLNRWKAAVLSGDKAALAAMYSTSPHAVAETPKGKTNNPTEEPDFWASLHPMGLMSLEPKILEMETLRPGLVQLVLHIELGVEIKSGARSFVVSASQLWAQEGNDWRIVATQRSDLVPRVILRLAEPVTPNVRLYPGPSEAPADLNRALAEAARSHKRVIVVFGANWCYDCHVLDAAFHSEAIAPIIEANYEVVHVNIGEGDKNVDLAKRYGVPLEKGIPSLAVLESNGKLVVSQKQGEFESAARIGPEDVIHFLEEWKPPKGK